MLLAHLHAGRVHIVRASAETFGCAITWRHGSSATKCCSVFAGKQASAYCPSCSDLVFASVVAWTKCWLMSLPRWSAGLHRVLCQPRGPPMYTATRCNIMSVRYAYIASLTSSTCPASAADAAVWQVVLRTPLHASASYSLSYNLSHTSTTQSW